MKKRLFICAFISVVAFAEANTNVMRLTVPAPNLDEQNKKEFMKGIADADRDFSNGVYQIEVYGLRAGVVSPREKYLEQNYQIKEVAVAGCCVNSQILSHVEGYNKRMKELLLQKYRKDVFLEAETGWINQK